MKYILISILLMLAFNSCEQTVQSGYILKEDLDCKPVDSDDYYSEECTINGKPFTGLAKEFYEDGTLEAEYQYLSGKWNGTITYYNEKGIRTYIAKYENGVVEGEAYRYEDDGTLESTEVWFNGEKLRTILP